MRAFGLIIFVACFWQAIVLGEKVRFDHYRVCSVHIETQQQLNVLRELQIYPDGISFVAMPTSIDQIVDLIIPPHKFADISETIDAHKFKYRIKSENLQKLIDAEQPQILSKTDEFGWKQYYNLSTIYRWLDQMVSKYPKVLTDHYYGKSHEGQLLRAITVSHKKNNPTIFIESTIHANEWITVTTATYFLNELITSNRTEIRYLADNFDWVIVPIVNPDGYEYTHTSNRIWRKNRRQNPTRPHCFGTDLNRNFDSHHAEVGASTDPCSEHYAGPTPFSEIETESLAEFVKKLNMKLYMTFHSFGQFVIFPTMRIGLKTSAAISKRFKTNYTVGTISEIIYMASGNSVDWVYDNLNVPLTYGFELRGLPPNGLYVPADQIIPNALEMIDGLVAMISEAKALNYL